MLTARSNDQNLRQSRITPLEGPNLIRDSSARTEFTPWLLLFGDIPNQRQDSEEFLGRKRRSEQADMFENLQLSLSDVVTGQQLVRDGQGLGLAAGRGPAYRQSARLN